MWRWLLEILLLLAILGGGFYYVHYYTATGKAPRQQHAPVIAATAVRKDVPIWLDALGTIEALNSITVKSQVTGQLLDEPYKEGLLVKAGDVLAHIDPRPYQAALDQAVATLAKDQATLDNARVDLIRYTSLGTAVSAQTTATQKALVDQLVGTVEADKAAIDSAKTQLSYTTVTAPVDGIVGIQQVNPGNTVQVSDANGIVLLTEIEPITVVFSLPQQDISEINQQIQAQKDKLTVVATDTDGQTILDKGELIALDNQVNQTTGAVLLKAEFSNAEHKLWPGEFVNARLLLTTRQAALTVPTVAIQRGPNGAYVFLLDPEARTVSMKSVKLGPSEELDTIIEDGLKDGDPVIVEGMAKLEDGMRVTVADPNADPAKTSAEPQKKHGSHKSKDSAPDSKGGAPAGGQGTAP